MTFLKFALVLHISACFYYAAAKFNLHGSTDWVRTLGIQDEGMIHKWHSAMYWATVTCTTVGYGDITPTNDFELLWTVIIMILGVALLSYFLSDLSSQFSEIVGNKNDN